MPVPATSISRRSSESLSLSISPPLSLSLSHTDSESSKRRSRLSLKLSGRLRTEPVVSTGRGGSGNLVSAASQPNLNADAAEARLQKRQSTLNVRVVTIESTGRGGTGNILAASVAQAVPFDKKNDPDDDYELVILQAARQARREKMLTTPTLQHSTGRGGTGNLLFTRPRSQSIGSANESRNKGKSRPRSLGVCSEGPDDVEGREMDQRTASDGASQSHSAPVTPMLHVFPAPPAGPLGVGETTASPNGSPRSPRGSEGDREKWWRFGRRQQISRSRARAEVWRTRTVQPDGALESFLEF